MKRASWYPHLSNSPAVNGMATLVGGVAYPSLAMAERITDYVFDNDVPRNRDRPGWIKIGESYYPWEFLGRSTGDL
jgi:hypothetical protein